jgi:hypothetical protein
MKWTETSPATLTSRRFGVHYRQHPRYTPQISYGYGSAPSWTEAKREAAVALMQAATILVTLHLEQRPVVISLEERVLTGPRRFGHQQTPNARSPIPARVGDDPVDLATGELVYEQTDIAVPAFGVSFAHRRTYRSRVRLDGAQGVSWDHIYDQRIQKIAQGCSSARVEWLTGEANVVTFEKGTTEQLPGGGQRISFGSGFASPMRLTCETPSQTWRLADAMNGEIRTFTTTGTTAYLDELERPPRARALHAMEHDHTQTLDIGHRRFQSELHVLLPARRAPRLDQRTPRLRERDL